MDVRSSPSPPVGAGERHRDLVAAAGSDTVAGRRLGKVTYRVRKRIARTSAIARIACGRRRDSRPNNGRSGGQTADPPVTS